MAVHLYTGRWQDAESLGIELLADSAQRPPAEDLHSALALLYAMGGELDAARTSLERLAPWTQSDDDEFRALYGRARPSILAGRRADRPCPVADRPARRPAASALLEEAITIFQSLGAAPALARARHADPLFDERNRRLVGESH